MGGGFQSTGRYPARNLWKRCMRSTLQKTTNRRAGRLVHPAQSKKVRRTPVSSKREMSGRHLWAGSTAHPDTHRHSNSD
jgi:hypothetical protein